MPHESLQDHVALVTGGSRGFGFLLARELGRRGCRVAICARNPMELDEARERLAAEGVDALAVPCDVGVNEEVERMVREVVEHFGRVDILLNNAGEIQVGPVESMRLQDFQRAMDVAYWGTVHTTLAVLPLMKGRGSGRIANVTSIGGKISVPHMVPYTAAKFAATGFSESLRAELAPEGISVTTIVPGLMRTGSYRGAARYKGDARKESAWFGLMSSLPVVSMDAERAARQAVHALVEGQPEIVLGLPWRIAARASGIAPSLASRVLGLFERALPQDAASRGGGVRGEAVLPDTPTYRAAETLGARADERFGRPRQ